MMDDWKEGGGHRSLGRGHPFRRPPLLCPLQALQSDCPDLDTKYETGWKTKKVESPREESEQNPFEPKCTRNLEVPCYNSNKLTAGEQISTWLFLPVESDKYRNCAGSH